MTGDDEKSHAGLQQVADESEECGNWECFQKVVSLAWWEGCWWRGGVTGCLANPE